MCSIISHAHASKIQIFFSISFEIAFKCSAGFQISVSLKALQVLNTFDNLLLLLLFIYFFFLVFFSCFIHSFFSVTSVNFLTLVAFVSFFNPVNISFPVTHAETHVTHRLKPMLLTS